MLAYGDNLGFVSRLIGVSERGAEAMVGSCKEKWLWIVVVDHENFRLSGMNQPLSNRRVTLPFH